MMLVFKGSIIAVTDLVQFNFKIPNRRPPYDFCTSLQLSHDGKIFPNFFSCKETKMGIFLEPGLVSLFPICNWSSLGQK